MSDAPHAPSDAPSRAPSPRLLRAAGLALLLAWLLRRASEFDFLADDAFISMRYARNLVEGHGLVWNVGDRVEGYTNFLWVLALAGARALGVDLVHAASLLGCACALGVVLVAVSLGEALVSPARRWLGLFGGAVVAVNTALACWAFAGLEGPLFALLLASSALAFARGRLAVAGLLAGTSALTRPEGLLWVAALAAAQALYGDRRGAARAAGAAALVVAPHLLWRRAYYGAWLPNTFHAKVSLTQGHLAAGLDYLSDASAAFGWPLLAAFVVLGAAVRPDRRVAAMAGFTAAYLGYLAVIGGDGLPMFRFAVPVLPFLAALAARGADVLLGLTDERPVRRAVGALLALAVALGARTPTGAQYEIYRYQRDVEIPRWSAVGRWLRAVARPGDSVACVPVGAIGYYSGLPLVDMMGLTDSHIARAPIAQGPAGWIGHERRDGAYVLSRRPTYLLLGNVDVTPAPRAPDATPFIPIASRAIWERESDILRSPELRRLYEPASGRLADGTYVNYYRLR